MNRSQNKPRGEELIEKSFMRKRLWHEMVIAARFGLVGMVSTTVHILVVWLLLVSTVFSPIVANTIAFLTAFSFI